jgi:hypothetical protein
MAMNRIQPTLMLLAALWGAPIQAEDFQGATATPVPLPQAAPAQPSDAELQAKLADLQGFMAQVDGYIRDVQMATENYRGYVQRIQQLLAGCEVESDTAGFEHTGFEELVADGGRQCQGWVADFNQQAQQYAARLDEAVAFQRTVEQVGGRAQGQIDRLRIMQHALRLKETVDQGLRESEATREGFRPWMDQG